MALTCSMLHHNTIRLIECPRDAMQGWSEIIPTQTKINYINALLQCGFDTIDFGSFVSAKAIPQMSDTEEVLKGLQLTGTNTRLLAIVANLRGAETAMKFDEISYLGFPFSISPEFQRRNTNSSLEASFETVEALLNLCLKNQKKVVVYLSMGFGNPYGDPYNDEIVMHWVDKLVRSGVEIISIADTVGLATPAQVASTMNKLIPRYQNTEIGVHLHSGPTNWQQKLDAALQAGCTRFDGALRGIGGCPMAGDTLIGNMDTELMIPYFVQLNLLKGMNMEALGIASGMAKNIFNG